MGCSLVFVASSLVFVASSSSSLYFLPSVGSKQKCALAGSRLSGCVHGSHWPYSVVGFVLLVCLGFLGVVFGFVCIHVWLFVLITS